MAYRRDGRCGGCGQFSCVCTGTATKRIPIPSATAQVDTFALAIQRIETQLANMAMQFARLGMRIENLERRMAQEKKNV